MNARRVLSAFAAVALFAACAESGRQSGRTGGFDARFAMLYDAHGRTAGTYALDDGEWLFQAR